LPPLRSKCIELLSDLTPFSCNIFSIALESFSETRGASVSDGINGDEKSADNKLSNIKTDSSELQSPFRTSNENQVRLSSNENQTHKFSTSFNNGEVKVAKIAKNGNIIEVKLDPASYGKIEIKFEFVENTNRANILVLADKSETLEFLRNDSRKLTW
jgi:hypothetical protein